MSIFNCSSRVYHKGFLSKMNGLMDIKTFVFLDIETTGLPRMENNRTKITELCMVAVEACHVQLGIFPRVQNKLNFCFNPWRLISSESEKMTGLSNHILEHQSKFSSETVKMINCFLNHNQKPVCFVAHNGNNFDYPILHREIEKTGISLVDDIVCIDSIEMFRQLHSEVDNDGAKTIQITGYSPLCIDLTDDVDVGTSQRILHAKKVNETTPKKQIIEVFPCIPSAAEKVKRESSRKFLNFNVSFKLSDIYTRLTRHPPIKEHQAEGDVTMLITCAATLGDKFVSWANTNAKKFCDIPSMVPGKKIGT